MIEAIRNIGEYVVKGSLTRDEFLYGICKKVLSEKSNKKDKNNPFKQYVVILDFDTSQRKIKIDLEPVSSESGEKYLFVGNAKANKLKFYISTNSFDALVTEVFNNISKNVDNNLLKCINLILNNFFITYSIKEKNKEEVFHLIKPDGFDFFDKKIEDIKRQVNEVLARIKDISSKAQLAKEINIKKLWKDITGDDYKIDNKKDLEAIKKQIFDDCNKVMGNPTGFLLGKYMPENSKNLEKKDFEKELKKKVKNFKNDLIFSLGDNFSEQNVAFLTVKKDGNLFCQTDEYKQMIYDEKITNIFKAEGSYKDNYNPSGTCSICANQQTPTTSKVTSLDFKFYITDKKGFSSNLDNKFTKNYNICRECYQYLMLAENFIKEKLNTRIGDMDLYLIPQFILKVEDFDIDDFSECLKDTNKVLVNIDSIKDFQKEWEKFIKYSQDNKNSFVINYLFYRPSDKGDFKILKLIKDVPPSRLDLIKRIEEATNYLVDSHFEGDKRLKIDLNGIYRCIPVKVVKNEKIGTAKYLDIIEAIFSDRMIDYGFLINQFAEVIRIIKFETAGYNIWNKNSQYNPDLKSKTLQLNLLLLFFKKLNILGGMDMEQTTSNIEYQEMLPDEIMNYWKNLELYEDERKRALFLLGYLIGEIGHRQSVKDIKNKPILNKINFQGMGTEKLIRVLAEMPDKLRQYDILQYNEGVHSVCQILMENHINRWKLSNQENVFYTLSGYAFSNYMGWQRGKKKIEDNIKQIENDIKKAEEDGKDMSEQMKQLQEAKKLFFEEKKYQKVKEILKQIKISEKEDK